MAAKLTVGGSDGKSICLSLVYLPANAYIKPQYPSSTLTCLASVFHHTAIMATSTVREPEDIPAALSQLCEKCSVLSFNDAELGYEKDGGFEPYDRWGLKLHYDQRDTLPDLPALKASASAGCVFCAALHEATLGL